MPIRLFLETFGYIKIKKKQAENYAMLDGVKHSVYTKANSDDDEFFYTPIYVRTRCSPFECMMRQVDKMNLESVRVAAGRLRGQIEAARADSNLVEPLHVQFVGKPRQCKTQMALRILDVLKQYKFLCVSRTSEDGFFDDLQKALNVAIHEKVEGEFVFHPDATDTEERRSKCKLDVMFLDELYSKKTGAADISTILNGITPMSWRPMMADPKNKGTAHKPFLWLSTANHEVTDHQYSVPALLKRVHMRFVVEGGKFYEQRCYTIKEPRGSYLGGFSTCKGEFGKWKVQKTSESTTMVQDPVTGKEREQVSTTRSSDYFEEVRDSSELATFLCSHCVVFKYEELIASIMNETAGKLRLSVEARERFRVRVTEAVNQQ